MLAPDFRVVDRGVTIPISLQQCSVADLVEVNGDWKFHGLGSWLLADIVNRMHAIHPPRQANDQDKCMWPCVFVGGFSIAYAYNALCGFNLDDINDRWSRV